METIFIRGTDYAAPSDLHSALKLLLDLPDYYGMNADALYDCLSERREPVSVAVRGEGTEEVAATLDKVRRVVEDLEGTYKTL